MNYRSLKRPALEPAPKVAIDALIFVIRTDPIGHDIVKKRDIGFQIICCFNKFNKLQNLQLSHYFGNLIRLPVNLNNKFPHPNVFQLIRRIATQALIT